MWMKNSFECFTTNYKLLSTNYDYVLVENLSNNVQRNVKKKLSHRKTYSSGLEVAFGYTSYQTAYLQL